MDAVLAEMIGVSLCEEFKWDAPYLDGWNVVASVHYQLTRIGGSRLAVICVDSNDFSGKWIRLQRQRCPFFKKKRRGGCGFRLTDWRRRRLINEDILRRINKSEVNCMPLSDGGGCRQMATLFNCFNEDDTGRLANEWISASDDEIFKFLFWKFDHQWGPVYTTRGGGRLLIYWFTCLCTYLTCSIQSSPFSFEIDCFE